MATRGGTIRIGISGWTYAPWRGSFYPKKLAHRKELAYTAGTFPSVEINGTFYSLQRPTSFARWYEQTPAGFVFAVKAHRFITHMKRLKDVQTPVANFLLSGPLRLREKLGPILWQLPPTLKFDPEILEHFLKALPYTTADAVKMKRHTDARMKGRTVAETDKDRPLRHAIEPRHDSFVDERFVKLLRRYNVACVVTDGAGQWPMIHDVTADFVYARLHGDKQLYASGYTDKALTGWAKKVRRWSTGGNAPAAELVTGPVRKRSTRDVYVYFDNDVKVRSPLDASRLAVKLGLRDDPLTEPDVEVTDVPRTRWPGVKQG